MFKMQKITFVALILFCTLITKAQEKQTDSLPPVEKNSNELPLEAQPQFPGGGKAFYEYMAFEVRKYKSLAKKGRMLVKFIVEKDGTITNIIVLEGLNKEFDKKVCEVIARSPKWSPGIQKGKIVRASFVLPITIN